MTQLVLPYDRGIVGQERYYDCGPASAQNVLSSRMNVSEADLIRGIGTTENGTDYVGLIERELDRRVPDARYTSVYLPNDPPTQAQREKLNLDIKNSIRAGWGVVMNWVAPPSNYPRGTRGSASPSYGGGTVFHYVAAMGIVTDDNDWVTDVWIADSGFSPFGYWCAFDQVATLIPPKGYAFADVTPAAAPPPLPPTQAPPIIAPVATTRPKDPTTITALTKGNRYAKRNGLLSPMWAAVHTSESRSRARNLRDYCEGAEVSYNKIVDDLDIVTMVSDADAPWSAVGANTYAYHVCASSSFASWSREQWLDPNPSDGFNEDAQLTNIAKVLAFWCALNPDRQIPAVWIGGGPKPPWGLNGICGHVDFGAWGGGHSDPGGNFPVNTLIARVTAILTDSTPVVIAPLPPVGIPGTQPDSYADWLEYAGKPDSNPDRVSAIQKALHRYSYGKAVVVDGLFGPLTKAAVVQAQKNVGLVADGIVGPMTAAVIFGK